MLDPFTEGAFKELITRGLVSATPAPRSLGLGNSDRRGQDARSSWCAFLPDGGQVKVTLGRNLRQVATRHAEFARACPDIATNAVFFASLTEGEAMAEGFFEGMSLEVALSDADFSQTTITEALTRLLQGLAATERPSSEAARQEEWKAWSHQLLALPVWQSAERENLDHQILPFLYGRLAKTAPVTRWTNGDFLPANVLISRDGDARLIDTEFAMRTHFFAEDGVRLRALSSATEQHPYLDLLLPPRPGLAWHLYFWLRQFQLEVEHNSSAYLERFRKSRLALIQCLARYVLGSEMPRWSTPALRLEHRIEDRRWSDDTDRLAIITGWCNPPASSGLRCIAAIGPDGQRLAATSPAPRPDVQQHFGGEPSSFHTGFSLRVDPQSLANAILLCAVIDQGTLVPFHMLAASDLPRGALRWDDYPAWAARYDQDPLPPASGQASTGPFFSILLPVYQTPGNFLQECVSSVLRQHYTHWELCIVDDGSGSTALTEMLSSFANADPRVRVAARRINGGISKATNDALAMARGEFVVLLDHDDKLRPHTLAAFVRELAIHPDLDAIYSDEDKIAPDGRRILPFFKPDFSPEFLRGVMYIGHALCVRTSIARAAGGFDPQYDGIQDYEFLLRVTEHTRKVGHTPHILYHWRQSATSSALHGNVKGNMDKKQSDAVRAHLRRVGDLRTVVELGGHRVRMEAGELPTYDVIAFENPKDLPIHLATAARSSQAEVLVLMARPIEAEGKACVRELVALAALPDSGCVGPVILSGDDRVLESGRIGEQPIMLGFHADSDGYNGSLRCNREVDALSPVCIAIKRTLLTACPESAFREWRALCNELRARGFYHRICAAARVQFPLFTTLNPDEAIDGPLRREFYNNHFDRQTGDYALLPVTSQLDQSSAPFVFNVEQPEGWSLISRCLIVRGWCFLANGRPIAGVRLRAQDRVLAGVVGLSRPDVTEAWPNSSGVNPGFELRGTLPSGKFNLALDAQLPDGRWLNFAHYSVHVGSQFLPLWLGGGDWMELMFFQMPAHMAYPPKKVALEKFPTNASQAKHPRISIVTPSFNQAGFLPETMRSVLDQTGVACDYVVQDGGSTDGSAALIKDQSQRLTAWASERDSGQAGAIAQGFAKTSGGPDDLMAWINSDDYYLPGALAFVSDYFARHPAVDVLYGHRVVVDEESQEIARWFLPKHDPEVLRLNDFVPQETLFWRRRIWDKVGGIDTSFKFAMDWDLLLRFQAAGARIVRVPYFLACFRVHSAQKTSARMHDIGQQEITRLRERTHGRTFPAAELEKNPTLLRYLRRSAFIEFLWKLGLRAP